MLIMTMNFLSKLWVTVLLEYVDRLKQMQVLNVPQSKSNSYIICSMLFTVKVFPSVTFNAYH